MIFKDFSLQKLGANITLYVLLRAVKFDVVVTLFLGIELQLAVWTVQFY